MDAKGLPHRHGMAAGAPFPVWGHHFDLSQPMCGLSQSLQSRGMDAVVVRQKYPHGPGPCCLQPVILLDVPPSPACLVLGLPHLASRPDEDSLLAGLSSKWSSLVQRAKVFRISPCDPESLTPEAAWLGLDPSEWQIAQGPLTVAALGRTPPERAICFHLTLGAVNPAGHLSELEDLAPEEADEAATLLLKLQTKKLTILPGVGVSHGLVWENGPREVDATPWSEALGKAPLEACPRTEDEGPLRTFIEDSMCLLENAEVNRRRRGEGLSPISVAWPWGPGESFQAPSLPLRRGAVLRVHSRSMRMMGLARLFGEWHCPPARMGTVHRIDWPYLRASLNSPDPCLAIIHPIPALQQEDNLEILELLLEQVMTELIEPWLLEDRPHRLTVLAPSDPYDGIKRSLRSSPVGLGFNVDSRRPIQNIIPFDERALDEPKASMYPLHEAAQRAVFDPYR
jgi:hypothetical protein